MKETFHKVWLMASMILCSHLPVFAESQDTLALRLDELIDKISPMNEPDTLVFFNNVAEAKKLANQLHDDKKLGKCYHYLICYLCVHGIFDRANQQLEQLKRINEKAHLDGISLYDSWQNIILQQYTANNILTALMELNRMQQYASEHDSHYGMGYVHMAFATFYSHSYNTSMTNLEQALEMWKQCVKPEALYYVYYCMAYIATDCLRYEEALEYVEKMVECEPDLVYVQQVADYIRLDAYLALGNRNKAKECYKRLKAWWDSYEINGMLEGKVARSMAGYLCEYDNPDLVLDIMQYIGADSRDMQLEVEIKYYEAKGNYRKALELQKERYDLFVKMVDEKQEAEMMNANAFYNNQELEHDKQQLEIDNAKGQNRVNALIILVMGLMLISTFITALAVRRHNKQLKKERDNTEKQRAIAENQRAIAEEERNKAIHLSEMKTTLINNMSHEVRTPLNSIIGFNDLLNNTNMEFPAKERKDMVNALNQQSRSLIHLLDNVIFLSRIDGNDIQPRIEPVSLAGVCQTVVEATTCKLHPGVTIEVKNMLTAPVKKDTDRFLLISALTQVMDNAAKFTKQGHICLLVNERQIIVEDTSDGIPAESAESIFERFEKLGRYDAGFGLGLSIARETLALIGGSIRLDTSYTQGCRFIIDLP